MRVLRRCRGLSSLTRRRGVRWSRLDSTRRISICSARNQMLTRCRFWLSTTYFIFSEWSSVVYANANLVLLLPCLYIITLSITVYFCESWLLNRASVMWSCCVIINDTFLIAVCISHPMTGTPLLRFFRAQWYSKPIRNKCTFCRQQASVWILSTVAV